MRRITLELQSEALARRRALLGDRVPSVPANTGGRRTESKVALLDRLDAITAATGRPARFIGKR